MEKTLEILDFISSILNKYQKEKDLGLMES